MGQGQVPEPGLWGKKKPTQQNQKEAQKSFKVLYSNQFSVYHSLRLVKRDCVLQTAQGKHELHPFVTQSPTESRDHTSQHPTHPLSTAAFDLPPPQSMI